jgi:hypothetical protein
MSPIAVLRRDLEPGLPQLLGSPEPAELEKRLRDRVEFERLRKQEDEDLAELREARKWLKEHSEQPALPEDVDPEWLVETAAKVERKEREATVHFRPVIAVLKQALNPARDTFEAEVQQLLRDAIEVLEGWLAFYRGVRTMLARQAEERSKLPGVVLRARPVPGDIDHEALSREFMARFPKIRAALAK